MNIQKHHLFYAKYRQVLTGLGYPVLPVREKVPAEEGWRHENYKPSSGYGGYSIGIRTGIQTFPIYAVDIDVYEAEIVEELKTLFFSTFGKTIYRIGLPPKCLLVYRGELAGISKMHSNSYDISGQKNQIEILGAGQQFVAFGIHPKTKQPYTWPEGCLLDISASDLPLINMDLVRGLL